MFWNSLHQSTLSCSYVLYAIQTCIFPSISSSQQPSTTLHSSHQAHTQSNHQPSPQCHAPSHKFSTTYCCPTSKFVSAHHGPPLPWPWGIMWSKVPPHAAPRHAHHFESSRETGLVPLKKQLRASLDRHEEPLVCWENIESSDRPDVAQALHFHMPS